ncbi:hypothetical protein DFH11DRAFT_452873 [Phellopilus nigrolimitatus]|nr:hypothetical protein DFH11DRAFT_452873 [Phellopilus nigrolimitatus]
MSVTVDDAVSQWIFSNGGYVGSNMSEAEWHQLADDPSANLNGYYNGTAIWTDTPGASASLIFQGTELIIYSATSPQGGQMTVLLDNSSANVSLSDPISQLGDWVYMVSDLDPGMLHAVTVQAVGGGRINIDKVGISPPPQSPFAPAMPQPLPPA